MPRNLPWMQNGAYVANVKAPHNKLSSGTSKHLKRARGGELETHITFEDSNIPAKKRTSGRAHSTSPPPEPPSERFMDEGMDYDDKYRMVEDEFLRVAQKWTVNLHAAEFKKLQKIAKTRNADVINSISRPVTERMPNQTRRRVDGLARSKAQRTAIGGLLGQKINTEDTDSDESSLPHLLGTHLHELMVSPGKKATSLSKVGSAKASTRASAGFQGPARTKKAYIDGMSSSSPSSKHMQQNSPSLITLDISTASEDEDDDLDAPIKAPKLRNIEQTHTTSLSGSRLVTSSIANPALDIPESKFTHSSPPEMLPGGWRAQRLEKARKALEEKEREERRGKSS